VPDGLIWRGPPPWMRQGAQRWRVLATLSGGSTKKDPTETLHADAATTILEANADRVFYTDGSAEAGVRRGGSAAVVTSGGPRDLQIEWVLRRKGAWRTSSFETELAALHLAMDWLEGDSAAESVLICTDSQALLRALDSPPASDSVAVGSVRERLWLQRQAVVLQWVPGHCGLEGNELADGEANVAAGRGATVDPPTGVTTATSAEKEGVSWSAAKSQLRAECLKGAPSHDRVRAVFGTGDRKPAPFSGTRREQVLLAQLRAGHCSKLAAYCRIVNPAADPTCPRCGEEPEDLEHWLQRCPATQQKRMRIFGCLSPPLSVLTSHPSLVIPYAAQSFGAE
jgi:ribonuclease HI